MTRWPYVLGLSIAAITIVGLLLPLDLSLPLWLVMDVLGDAEGYVVITLALYFLLSPRIGYSSLLIILVSGLVNIYLKDLLRIPRPEDALIEAEGYSFPSGHAQVSGTFWTALYLFLKSRAIVVIGAPYVALISVSRLALGVHTPADVLGGIVIGFVVGLTAPFIIELIDEYLLTRYGVHVILGSIALLMYVGMGYETLLKIGGVALGMAMHHVFYREDLELDMKTRLVGYIGYLVPAFILTRLAFDPVSTFTVFLLIGGLAPAFYFRLLPMIAGRT